MNKELLEFSTLSLKPVLSEQEKRRFDFYKKTLPTGSVAVNPTQKFENVEDRSAAIVAKYTRSFEEWAAGKLPEERFRAMIDAGEFRTDNITSGAWGGVVAPLTYIGGDLQGNIGSGIAGGFTCPPQFYKTAINSTKQFSELLDENNVRLVTENSFGMPGRVFVGFDFSSFLANRASVNAFTDPNHGDATQVLDLKEDNTMASFPPTYAKMLTSTIYAITLRVERDLERDASVGGLDGGILGELARGFGEGFGRRVGTDLAVGTGQANGQPSGIVTGAASSGVSAALSYDTLESIYFSVNRAYRNSSKCAWLMSDGTYQAVRKLKDDDHRPLFSIDSDGEKLFGKKILISPDVPTFNASPSVTGEIVFGDFSHYIVRCSQMWLQRNVERFVDFSEVGLLARLRVDGILFDPSLGVTPPITKAAIIG